MKQLNVIENKYAKDAIVISNESVLKVAMMNYRPESIQHFCLLETFRQCNRCPLGAKKKIILVGREKKTINISAVCSMYEKDKTVCPVDRNQYAMLLKEYYRTIETPEYEEELAKYLMTNIVSDAMLSRDVEVIEKGRPGFLTNKHMETAAKLFDSMVKLKTGSDRHLHLHSENMADKIVDAMFKKEDTPINLKTEQKSLDEFKD